jgi:hypothetical protein
MPGANGSGPSSPSARSHAAAAGSHAAAGGGDGSGSIHAAAQQEAHALGTLATTHDFMQQVRQDEGGQVLIVLCARCAPYVKVRM